MSDFLDDVVGIDPNGGGIFSAAGDLAGPAAAVPIIGGALSGGLNALAQAGGAVGNVAGAVGAAGGDDSPGFFDQATGQWITSLAGGAADYYNARQQGDAANQVAQLQAQGVQQARGDVLGAGESALSRLGQGAQAQRDAIGQAYDQAGNLISPMAGQAQQFTNEQMALLGLSGDPAQQAAMSRVSDPLVAEQERAFMRNQAALGGGVGLSGNILSALAEQTRNRTQSNIGQRLAQLQSSGSPALNALQQLSQQHIGRGQTLSGIEGQAGTAGANAYLGQGGQLSQLSQSLGNVRAGAPAFQAQQVTPFTQGIQSVLSGMASTPPPNQGQNFVPPPLPQVR